MMANGQAWRNQYNDQGLLIKVVDAKGGVNTLDYNNVGQLIKQTDCSQQSSTYDYDGKGHVVNVD